MYVACPTNFFDDDKMMSKGIAVKKTRGSFLNVFGEKIDFKTNEKGTLTLYNDDTKFSMEIIQIEPIPSDGGV